MWEFLSLKRGKFARNKKKKKKSKFPENFQKTKMLNF